MYKKITQGVLKDWNKNYIVILFLLVAGMILGIILSIWENLHTHQIKENYLERNEYQGGEYEEKIKVKIGEDSEELVIKVPEQEFSEQEILTMLDTAIEDMENIILGKNESLQKINQDLNLITQISGTPLEVDWMSNQVEFLDWEGKLGDEIPKEGKDVVLTADIRYQDYVREYQTTVTVFPKKLSEKEMIQRDLNQFIERFNKENNSTRKWLLPSEYEGETLIWFSPKAQVGPVILGISFLGIFLIVFSKLKEEEQEAEKIQKEMLWDYPEIICKLTLLMGAGLSSRRAFEKIVKDYQRRKQRKRDKRCAYEQLEITYYEMAGGASEIEAYIHMGERIPVAKYKTFAALLGQNLVRGSKGIGKLLEQEAAEAFEDRKRQAKILGEEAGTKLLFPMILMLGLVFIILMVPAFLTF